MKNRRRIGGIIRLLLFIVLLAAAVAGIRLAAGKILSGRADAKAAETNSSSESGPAAGSSALTEASTVSTAPEGSDAVNAGQDTLSGTSGVSVAAGTEGTADGTLSREGTAAASNTDGAAGAADASNTEGAAGAADAPNTDGAAGAAGAAGTSDPNAADGAADDATSAAAVQEPEEPAYDHVTTELENGQAYLASLEERTPVEMEYMIAEAQKEYQKEVQREQYRQKRQAYLEDLEGDRLWEAFDDFVFLGDSRVVGFDVFGYLPSERVLADAGDTINSITDRMDTIKYYSPKYIFISYGINDIGIGFWPTKEEYAAAFAEKLHTLQKEVPDAEIYVNSIIPARDDAAQIYTIWQGLPEYSEAVRQMCEKEGISFIDNKELLEEHEDLYDSDGVHMQPDFYRYWAENQLLAIFDRENGLLTF